MWFLLVLLYASSPHLSSTQEYRLILQDGDGPCEGYVKIFYNNKWGVVGDQKWHENNEKVICKSIGCGTSVRSKDIVLQKVWDITWMNEVECDGNEEYLWNCVFPGWNISSYTKDTLKLITCSDKIHLELESLPGYRCAGTLKYKKTSMEKVIETGYFIHPNWDKQQADLVCEHLKCGQSKGLPAAGTFSRKETLTNLKPIKCSSVEHQKHIWQCITKDDVGNGEPVAVICSDHHNFRLQGGDNVCSGELEVDDGGGLWKPVCQSQYKLNASNHDLCSHMRCGTNHVQERMVCDGSKNISLDCTDKVNTLLLDDQSQSVSHCFGSVHFNHSGRLEAVCFNDWDTKDGEVVCRELNCGEVVSVRSGSQTKDGMHDRVDCKGSEASLWHCLANHYENSTTCSKVKVICSGSVNVRLSDGPGKCAGRVEIQYDGVWKSVSASNWKVENSKVMCNELRCGDALDAPDSFIQGMSPVMNIEVTCANDSKSISYCIKPKKTLKQQQKKNKMLICQEHKVVFLVGGSACSGKVGIERAGKSYWLSASNDTWDHETATVVCQQMDCGNAISISFESTSTVLASGTTELWKYSYNCRSKEKSIFDCKRSKRLSNHSIASVVCSGNKTVSLNGQGEGKCWGKVNVCLNGMCGGVCEDAWTKNKSDMLCKALSCGSAIDPLSYPPSAEDKITISSVHSTQQTTNINQCNMVKNVDGSSCQKNPAIVVCSESVEAKIIDHRERCSGNVKMFYQGNWHPVCKTALQNQDVQNTICRELGCGQAVKALSLFGPSPESSVAVVSNLTCNATSKSSSECRVNLTQTNQCPLGGLQCSEWRRMVLKLGKGACEGQVFVYSEGDSRAVSGDGWTKTEAKVLCADLGCGAYKNHSVGNADYNGLWWGKTYSCEGKTKSIWDCEKNDRPSQNQSLNVQCQDNFRASLVNLGDPGKCFGQVTLNNLPVCYDNWDDSHNKIACQEQECSNSVSFEETNKGSQNEGHFVSCVGSESNLGQCKTTRGKCSRGLVSVSCADRVKFNTTQKCGGNIEILYRDTWELVCKPDINTENILCKELGCHYFSELNRGQFEITEEEKRERRRPEVSLRCPPDIKKLQHCLVKNGCDKPGKITCKGYSLKEPIVPTPINLYVGLSLGALSLVMVAALCLFLRRRFVTRFKSRFSMRKESTFESGDYEDVETNGHELLGPTEMRDLNHHESESGGDKENGRRSATSSLSYDDIAEEENVPAQPLSSGGDGTSSPEHVAYEVEEDQQESYDDVVSMIPPAETREEIAEVHERPKPKGLEIHDG